jgi:hypothetical protein
MVGVKPEVHRELKKLQKTPYGEQTMSWVIANLLKASVSNTKPQGKEQ